MEITRGMLLDLAVEDWHVRAQWLRVWTEMAKEELAQHEEPWEPVYGLLFSAQVEARRRRTYLAEFLPEMEDDIPEIELEAVKTLHAMAKRKAEQSQKKQEQNKTREQ